MSSRTVWIGKSLLGVMADLRAEEASAHAPASPISAGSPRKPDPRPGRRRARLSPHLLSALALLLGALGFFSAAPAQAQTSWTATLTAAHVQNAGYGCFSTNDCNTRLTDNSFTVGGQANSLFRVGDYDTGVLQIGFITAPNSVLSGLNFCVGSTAFAISSADLTSNNRLASWSNANLAWSGGQKVPLSIGSTCPPGAPTGLSATAGNARLDLTWTAPTATGGSAITGYDVHYTSSTTVDDDADPSGSNPANAWVAVSRSGTGTTQALTGLTNGTTYKVRVRARNSGAARFWARTTAAPAAPTHAAPTGLTVTPGNRELGLSWTAPATGTVTGYDVHYTANATVGNDEPPTSLGSQQGWWDTDFTGTSTTDTLRGLTNGSTYRVRVRATYAGGNSAWVHRSGTPTGTAPTPPTPPTTQARPVLTALTVSAGGNAVAITCRNANRVGCRATVPYDTTSVRVTPTWSGTTSSATVSSRELVHSGNVLTAPRNVTSGGYVDVALASGLPANLAGTEHRTLVRIDLNRNDGKSNHYGLIVYKGGPIGVSLSADPNPVREGGDHQKGTRTRLTVNLTRPSPEDYIFPISIARGTAEDGDWYVSYNHGVIVRRGQTSGYELLRPVQDADTDDETLTVTLDTANLPTPSSGSDHTLTAGSPTSVTVTIEDDDDPSNTWSHEVLPSVSLSVSPTTVTEGRTVTLTATLSEALGEDVTVPWNLAIGTGEFEDILGYDVVQREGAFVFTAGETTKTRTLRTQVDADSDDERFSVAMYSHWLPLGLRLGSPNGATITITDQGVVRPTGLTATEGDGRLDLSWTAPSSGTVTGYDVHYSSERAMRQGFWDFPTTDAVAGWTDANHTGTTATHALTGLVNGQEYKLRVRAKTAAGVSAWFGAVATPEAPPTTPSAPGAVTGLSATPGDAKLDLSWNTPTGTVTGYDVHYTSSTGAGNDDAASGNDPTAGWVDANHSGTTVSDALTSLTNGTPYRVRVRAVNAGGAGPWARVTATPAAPVVWSATLTVKRLTYLGVFDDGLGCGRIYSSVGGGCDSTSVLTDDDFSIDTESHEVHQVSYASNTLTVDFGPDAGNPPRTALKTLNFCVGSRAFALTGLTSGGVGTWSTSPALGWSVGDEVALSIASACPTGTPPTTPSAPGAPTGLAATPGDAKLDLAWTAPSGSVTGYDVHYTSSTGAGNDDAASGNDPTAGWVDAGHTGTTVSDALTSLTNGTSYRVRVRAVNAGGAGPWARVTATPVAPPVWSATLSVKTELTVDRGCGVLNTCASALTDDTFTVDGTDYSVTEIYVGGGDLAFSLDAAPNAALKQLNLCVGSTAFALSAGTTSVPRQLRWTNSGLSWSTGDSVSLSIASTCPTTGGSGGGQSAQPAEAVDRYAALIAQMYEWRNDPQWRHRKSHTDRWDRALLAFGEAVADSTLTAMSAAEAQAWADSGLSRWVEVAKALWEIEGATQAPVVTIAAGEAVTEGTAAVFTVAAAPAPASDLDVTVTVGQEGAFVHASTLGAHTVTIPAGGASATLELLTVDDAADEPDGSVTAALGTGTGYTVGDAASASVTVADDDGAQPQVQGPYAALIAQMYEWRNDPQWRHRRSHTDRWDRALLAFGEAVADGSLTAMTAAEAQAWADGGLARWVPVAKALWEIAGGRPAPVPAIDTKRGIAREGADDAVVFTVRLDRAASGTVRVDYATADGAGSWASTAPARAGADYTATSGTLTFAAGETSKSVSVPILDDAIDEGTEYFLLRFSNPRGATLAAGERETQGLIRNSDPLQAMWLARFGRMVASDAVASVTARLETPRDAGSHVTFAGQRMNFGEAEGGGGAALATVLTGLAQTFGAPSAPAAKDDDDDPFLRHGLTNPWNDSATVAGARRVTGRELLLGTSFRAVLGQGAGSQWTSWGQGASVSRFSGVGAGLGLSGESATGSMGMDYESGRLLLGFAMTHSVGEGTASDANWRYALGSTATMALPYARLALSDRVSVWGMAGTGTGRLSLDLDGSVPQSYRTDLAMTLAATGVRGDLVTPAEPGGFALALKADAFWVRTESDRVTASAFGSLAGAQGESSRVRAVLDGSRTFSFASGAALTPSLELGVRHDAGDAETGTGLEVGAGLGYADPSRGLDMALKVHGLAVHAEEGYDEWGVSGQLRLVPGGAGRGLSMSLTPSYGVDPSGSERLWALPASSGLVANGEAEPSSRFDAEVGYGMSLWGDRFTGTPNLGFGLSGDGARDLRLGWRLTSAVRGDPGFEVSLDATRREAANDNAAEHGVMLRSLIRW